MALPALVMVASLLLVVVGAASDAARTAEAARVAARSASLGTDREEVLEQVDRVAPGATARWWVDGPWVRVEVSALGRHWGPVPLPAPRSTASALLEPGVVP
jgi:hypothetical protein